MPSWLPGENVDFEQRDRALRQTVRVEFDGFRAHIAVEMQEGIHAHFEARIAEVRDYFSRQFANTAKCLQRRCAKRLIAS